ncbi:helix-turn-helix transcriptional regulator [Cohnella rhizosphaerae]|uniref:HTH domain-containing protein n=1 Tax=Cohnella rhizosphaerae TaxID=1457232 RepID=A0A9X4KT15_9BACL|nr:HTH domain-containing protein [Cohnella rhizosphaerae]MDG0810559.1 HTH domain-containing protein [Cohnella rhizosphaerae]
MKIDRLIALILILLERDRISARELAERLEVSRRTIYRDIDTLTVAGLPIYTHEGATGGVGLMKAYKVDKSFLSRREAQTLAAGLKKLSAGVRPQGAGIRPGEAERHPSRGRQRHCGGREVRGRSVA